MKPNLLLTMSDGNESRKEEAAAARNEKEEDQNKYQDDEDDKDDETREAEEKASREAARKRCYKYSDPPKIYTDVKVGFKGAQLAGVDIVRRVLISN